MVFRNRAKNGKFIDIEHISATTKCYVSVTKSFIFGCSATTICRDNNNQHVFSLKLLPFTPRVFWRLKQKKNRTNRFPWFQSIEKCVGRSCQNIMLYVRTWTPKTSFFCENIVGPGVIFMEKWHCSHKPKKKRNFEVCCIIWRTVTESSMTL